MERGDDRATDGGLNLRGTMLFGVAVVIAFFGILGGWAATAPLSSGAVASGTVSVEGRRKTVQHLEGGIVADIRVKEGQRVTAGDTVIALDRTRPKASLEVLRGQLMALLAQEARLLAERDNASQVVFPADLIAQRADAEIAKVVEGQLGIFQARRLSLRSQASILAQRTAQFREEISGLRAEIKAQKTQADLIAEELTAAQKLFAKGLQRKPKLLELQRRQAEIEGARAKNVATIARVEQNITETELQVRDLASTRHSEVVQELREVQTRIVDVRERLAAAEDVLNRTLVVAPTSGIVVDLRVHTAGAVIGPGEPLMDIVPSGEKLVIEARVRPTDIDIVHPGMTAQVRLTAFNQRTTPVLDARVERVSADALADERSGETYYIARIALDPGTPMPDDIQLYPGMPVEVLLVTGARTALEYLLQPIRESLGRAMREG